MDNKKLDEGMVLSDTCQAMVDIVPHRDHAHIRFRNAADDTAFGQWSQINTTIEVLQEVLDPAFFFLAVMFIIGLNVPKPGPLAVAFKAYARL